jgi:hypothetical protein
MKTTLVIILILILPCSRGVFKYFANYNYENTIGSYWDLSDKASTIQQKSEYIDKFMYALIGSHLEGTNANSMFPTVTTSFNENFKALKSLQSRLDSIKKMDEKSFVYQTAIQQITAQEQGEASSIYSAVEDCWMEANYPTIWSTLLVILFSISEIAILVGGIIWIVHINDNY